MAYPNYQMPYQAPYNPYFQQQYYPQQPMQTPQQAQQPAPQQIQAQPVPQAQPQIQNGGFMQVRTEDEAYNWPIAPGVGMTFKVENAPVIIDKSRGFSPLEQPVVKVYDMIERVHQQAAPVQPQEAQNAPAALAVEYAERSDVEALRRDIEAFKDEFKADLQALKDQPIVAEIKRTTSKAKKEVEE